MAVFDFCLWMPGNRGVIERWGGIWGGGGDPGPIQIHLPAKTPAVD